MDENFDLSKLKQYSGPIVGYDDFDVKAKYTSSLYQNLMLSDVGQHQNDMVELLKLENILTVHLPESGNNTIEDRLNNLIDYTKKYPENIFLFKNMYAIFNLKLSEGVALNFFSNLFWINVDSLSNFRLQDENFIFNNKFFSLFKNLNVSNELKKEIFKQMMLESKKNSQYTVGMSQILNVDTFNYLFHELPWNHVELKAFFKNNIPYFVDSDHFFSCSQISNSDKIELFKDYLGYISKNTNIWQTSPLKRIPKIYKEDIFSEDEKKNLNEFIMDLYKKTQGRNNKNISITLINEINEINKNYYLKQQLEIILPKKIYNLQPEVQSIINKFSIDQEVKTEIEKILDGITLNANEIVLLERRLVLVNAKIEDALSGLSYVLVDNTIKNLLWTIKFDANDIFYKNYIYLKNTLNLEDTELSEISNIIQSKSYIVKFFVEKLGFNYTLLSKINTSFNKFSHVTIDDLKLLFNHLGQDVMISYNTLYSRDNDTKEIMIERLNKAFDDNNDSILFSNYYGEPYDITIKDTILKTTSPYFNEDLLMNFINTVYKNLRYYPFLSPNNGSVLFYINEILEAFGSKFTLENQLGVIDFFKEIRPLLDSEEGVKKIIIAIKLFLPHMSQIDNLTHLGFSTVFFTIDQIQALYLFIEQNKLSYEKINEYLKDPISFIPHFTNSQERETLDLLLKYNINFSLTNNELILIGKVSTDVIKFFVNNYPLNIINKENFIHQLLLMNEIIFLQGPEHKHNQKRTKDADERQTKLLQLFNLLGGNENEEFNGSVENIIGEERKYNKQFVTLPEHLNNNEIYYFDCLFNICKKSKNMVELTQEETEILSQILTKKIPRAESMISGINNFFINKNNVSINSLNKGLIDISKINTPLDYILLKIPHFNESKDIVKYIDIVSDIKNKFITGEKLTKKEMNIFIQIKKFDIDWGNGILNR